MQDATPVDVGWLIDHGRWGGYQRWLVALAALTIVFDGIDNQLMGVALPAISREWGVPRGAFALVVSVGYAGMMIGGAVAGLLGDRFGRRVALLGSMAVFGVMTLAAAATDGVPALAVLRGLAGLGLGGAMPNAAALVAEYVPLRQRAVAVTVTIVCVPLGATLAGLIAIPVLPSFGWRVLFFAGGVVPLATAAVLARLLPESPRYLARHARRWPELARLMRGMGHDVPLDAAFEDAAESGVARGTLAALFRREYRRDTLALWVAFFSCLLAVYLGFSWVPSLLTGAGFSSSVASTGITLFNLGGVAGALAGGWCIGRWGSRGSMLAGAALAAAGALVLTGIDFSAAGALLPVMVMLTITGALINGVQTTMYALAAHVYPSAVRATGVGTAVAVGRGGAVLSGYVGAWAIGFHGSASFFGTMAVAMIVSWAGLAIVTRHIGRHVPRARSE
jgi:AAHS family 4-hydroxybenzoate transporter-like MFS transporter